MVDNNKTNNAQASRFSDGGVVVVVKYYAIPFTFRIKIVKQNLDIKCQTVNNQLEEAGIEEKKKEEEQAITSPMLVCVAKITLSPSIPYPFSQSKEAPPPQNPNIPSHHPRVWTRPWGLGGTPSLSRWRGGPHRGTPPLERGVK